ncbi:MAG TPA: hypothetical protein VLS96_01595 [Nodosilinea sp.]|nr:hypothetical protein [Nodosilinea sp.]
MASIIKGRDALPPSHAYLRSHLSGSALRAAPSKALGILARTLGSMGLAFEKATAAEVNQLLHPTALWLTAHLP